MNILTKTLFAALVLSAGAGAAMASESSFSDVDSPLAGQSPYHVQLQERARMTTRSAGDVMMTGSVMTFQSGIMVEGDTDGDGDVDTIRR